MQRLSFSRTIGLLSLLGCFAGAQSLYAQLSLQPDQQAAPQAPLQAQPLPSLPQPQRRNEGAETDVLNAVVAVVNEDVITLDDVRELTNSQEVALESQYPDQPDVLRQKIIELRGQAVKTLIDRQLILQEFKKLEDKGANIPDYIVEDHIKTYIRGQFNGDREAFIRTLDAQGITLAKFRERERDQIIVTAMREREIQKDLFIPPRDIEEYYHQHTSEFSTPATVHLRMISLKKGGATEETQKKLAEEIRQKVAGGADFGKMAQFYSDTKAAEQGDYGWVKREDLNEDLGKVAFSLKPGQISNIVDSSGSFWLLYVEAKQPGGTSAFKDVRGQIEQKLLQIQQQEEQEKWLAGLRQKAYIRTF